jgi:esterase/lipase
MKKKLGWLAAGAAGLGVILASGPRIRINHQRAALDLPADLDASLDAYLADSEARVPDIIPNTEKKITWANPQKTRTALALVYLHGFSATRQETAPLCEQVAAELGANLFCTRLAGHGLDKDKLGQCTASDWLNDALEAVEIGRRLGEKVIVLGVSTGGTLAAWLAMQPEDRDVLGYVLLSPNFAPRDPRSKSFTWPWAPQLVPLLLGRVYGWESDDPLVSLYWSHPYPTRALLEMMALVEHVRKLRLEQVHKPLLFIYSPLDGVVDSRETERQIARFGSAVKDTLVIEERINESNHVLAGDLVASANTARLKDAVVEFVKKLV